jgi:hypothetical protein
MSAIPTTILASEGFPNYPGFGEPDDIHARIMLLDWICEQLVKGNVTAEVGDYILATDGRILGVSKDPDGLHLRLIEEDPGLLNARIVAYRVPLSDY